MKRLLQLAATVALLISAWAAYSVKQTSDAARWWIQSPDAQGIVANVTVATRHAIESLDRADELTAAAKDSARESVSTQQAIERLIRSTDTSLNDEKLGVFPNARDGIYIATKDTHETLKQARASLDLLQGQTIELAAAGTATLNESTQAAHNLSELLGDKHLHETLVNIDKGTGAFAAAGTSVEQILDDLRHPEKPSKFVRALSIMLAILRGTALAGQSAPVFGR